MAPPQRAKSLPKAAFTTAFAKLKISTYTDNLRPSTVVSSSHYIRTLSWNTSGTLIATGAIDRTLRIWNPEKPQTKNSTELRGNPGGVERVAFHPENDHELASCGLDGMVRFWDVRTKKSVGEVNVGGEAFTLAWKPDGSDIVVGKKDNTIIPISRSKLAPIAEHRQHIQTNQCVFDWSGKYLFLTHGDGCVKIVDYATFDPIYTLNAHTSACYAVTMSPSGEYLAIGGGDALVSLWDTEEWMSVRTVETTGPVKSVDFSFDGSYVVGGSDEGNRLTIAHTETGEEAHHIDLTAPAAYVAWHPYRYVLAYSAEAQGLKIVATTLTMDSMNVQAALNPSTLFSAKGLVVVITGGGSGIGLAVASALHQNGASKVYILGRRLEVLKQSAETLTNSPNAPKGSSSSSVVPIVCDVTSQASISKAVDQITKETGYVDVLVNNAGVIGPKNNPELYSAKSITELSNAMVKGWDEWESTMAINSSSIVAVSAAFLPLLEAANTRRGFQSGKVTGKGVARQQDKSALEKIGADKDDDRMAHIITVASVASYMRYCTAGLAYNASKAAAAHLGKMLSTLLGEWGIRSNVVCPGPYPSDMTKGGNTVFATDEIPQGRPGNINDIAGLFLFLCGKGGAYTNGTVQPTDGGRLGQFPAVY
ncbi:WD40 repeat-like protein [Delitschia confertaspora ATCC 74209]|uniref:WD40 repeat-like protein n=1 Tax=Delitschia confertaspora ATCC 74209 TaxID=1513339 RepID=A0A9P4JUV3_9PLEO|nr:WD40 repeat-like protein [Delitschia confertaspora ATCC 74209]